MKKWIALLLAFSLCASLAACGGPEDPDHAYVLSLMERGDYDMAISVLENLRDKANGTTSAEVTPTEATPNTTEAAPATTEAPRETAPAETVTIIEAPAAAPQPVSSDRIQAAADLVIRFMEEKGNAMVEDYETNAGARARDISVSHAMEYQLNNWDTFPAYFLLVCLEADVFYDNVFNDKVYLLQDLDSGMIYDSSMLHDNIPDPAASMEDVCLRAVNAYISYLFFNRDIMWAEHETREELSAADISAINEALK